MKLSTILSPLLAVAAVVAEDIQTEEDDSDISKPFPKIPGDDHAAAAYFVNDKYVFALSQVDDGDVYFHMNAPAKNSWMGIGFGSQMKDAFMIISYVGSDGKTVINSPRMGIGHTEPVLIENVVIDGVYNDLYAPFPNEVNPSGAMIAHAVCRNCSRWMGGALDLTSTAQPMIYALGSGRAVNDDALDADLRMHDFHGSFTLDMTKAVNTTGTYGRVPLPQTTTGPQPGDFVFNNSGASAPYDESTDQYWGGPLHATMMSLALILVFPAGAVILRLTARVRWHMYTQILGFVLIIIGFASGVYISTLYNRTRNFNSAHQIIGLLVFAAVFIQLGLGLIHHTLYKRTKTPTIMGQIHRFLGVFIILLGMVNGGVGLNLANDDNYAVAYGVVVGIVGVLFLMGVSVVVFRRRQRKYEPEKPTYTPESGYGFDTVPEPPAAYEMRHGYSYTVASPAAGGFPRFQSISTPGEAKNPFDEENATEGVDTAAMEAKARWESVPLR